MFACDDLNDFRMFVNVVHRFLNKVIKQVERKKNERFMLNDNLISNRSDITPIAHAKSHTTSVNRCQIVVSFLGTSSDYSLL